MNQLRIACGTLRLISGAFIGYVLYMSALEHVAPWKWILILVSWLIADSMARNEFRKDVEAMRREERRKRRQSRQ